MSRTSRKNVRNSYHLDDQKDFVVRLRETNRKETHQSPHQCIKHATVQPLNVEKNLYHDKLQFEFNFIRVN